MSRRFRFEYENKMGFVSYRKVSAPTDAVGYRNLKRFLGERTGCRLISGSIVCVEYNEKQMPDPDKRGAADQLPLALAPTADRPPTTFRHEEFGFQPSYAPDDFEARN